MRALTALLFVLAAAPGTVQAVVGGTTAPHRTEVAALVLDGDRICSGVLVAPRSVATAAHCVDALPGSGGGLEVVFAARASDPAPEGRFLAARIHLHPGWTGPERIDVAVVLLAEDAAAQPASWSDSPPPVDWEVEALTLVGTGDAHAEDEDPWVLREASVWTDDLTLTHRFWWDDEAAICNGDSGGGVFAEGTSTLLAIATEGDADCAEWGAGIRIDRVASFLEDPTADGWAGLPDEDVEDVEDGASDTTPGGGAPGLALPEGSSAGPPAISGCDDGWSGSGWALLPLLLPFSLRPRRQG